MNSAAASFQMTAETKATPALTKFGLHKIAWVAIVGVALVILTWILPMPHFETQQDRNLKAAAHHTAILKPIVHADSRFHDVQIGPFTGDGGCLWVVGSVDTQSQSDALKALVIHSKPPVATDYSIAVLSTGKWDSETIPAR
jgi:hypothetical protein